MIRHEVEHVAEPQLRQARHESSVRSRPAELRVDRVVVGDVVAVCAPWRGGEIGRGIDGTDAEPGKIPGEIRCRVERKSRMELQSVGADWNVHG